MMSRSRLLRLGLFQLAAGSTSVIFLGVVNRVMRVDLGMDLFLVSLLVGGGHYLGALVAVPFGHFSDTHPIMGYRRTFYALGGALVTVTCLALAPFVAVWVSHNQTLAGILLGFGFFLLEGISTFIAGTAFLALIADQTTDRQRGPATGMVWTLLMLGIIMTGVGAGLFLRTYTFNSFLALALTGAGLAVTLSMLALMRQERRLAARPAAGPPPSLRAALRVMAHSAQTRWFAGFLMLAMFSYFMQDVILEPFGGEVFGLSAARTTRFNAYMGIGVISAMLLGGFRLIPRYGKQRVTAVGCAIQAGAFGLLAWASTAHQASLLMPAILALGFGAGLFTVGGVSLMMDLTSTAHTGLFVGAWTLIQALAKGPSAIAGGAIHALLEAAGLGVPEAYAGVFGIEAAGLLISLIFLSRVGVQAFQREVSFGSLAAEAMD
jgi:MFS transporter, BCD family, chlorophyll transporter